MMHGALLGVDFGTGGAKAALVDEEGKVLSYAFREYPIFYPHAGWSEHDPERYWSVLTELVQELLGVSGGSEISVRGIAVSSALPSLVLVDTSLQPLAPALNLLDRRATEEVSLIKSWVDPEVLANTSANRIEDHPGIVNLLWFKRKRPEIYNKVHKALTVDGFITARLTGRATVNQTSAVFYGVAYDIRMGRFSEEILQTLSIDIDLLPDVLEPTEVIGAVDRVAANTTGLPEGVPVVGGQVDCNAGWLAGGATEVGDVQLNLGTSGVLGIVHNDSEFLSSSAGRKMINIPYTTDPANKFVAVAATTTGGQTLRFLRDTIGGVEMEAARSLGVSEYDLLTMQAEKVPAGSDGLVVLPYLMGERSPIWDTSARAVIFGLSLHHDRGHIIRAFMEGVALALYDSYQVLSSQGLKMTSPLIFNEGGAKSALWRRIITDVFGVPTAMLRGRAGAPLGNAILAGVGVGVWSDFSIAKRVPEYNNYLEPNLEQHRRYGEVFDIFKDIYTSLTPQYEKLSVMRNQNNNEGGIH